METPVTEVGRGSRVLKEEKRGHLERMQARRSKLKKQGQEESNGQTEHVLLRCPEKRKPFFHLSSKWGHWRLDRVFLL